MFKSVSWDNSLPLANQLQARTCAAISMPKECDGPERCGYMSELAGVTMWPLAASGGWPSARG